MNYNLLEVEEVDWKQVEVLKLVFASRMLSLE
jgi:hypothetical protein